MDKYRIAEPATQRYWEASQAWRRHRGVENWTYGSMIQELGELTWKPGKVSMLSAYMLEEVVEDRPLKNVCEAQIFDIEFFRTQKKTSA